MPWHIGAPQTSRRVIGDGDISQAHVRCCYADPRHVRVDGREALFYDPATAAASQADIDRARVACTVLAIRVESYGYEGIYDGL